MTTPATDWSEVERLAYRALAQESGAWHAFVELVWPLLLRAAATTRSMRGHATEDHIRNVASEVMESLGAQACRGLTRYPPWRARNPDKDIGDWLRVVVANTARDYLRKEFGHAPSSSTEPHPKALLNEFFRALPEDAGSRPAVTTAQTARKILEFARDQLPEKQLLVLKKWLEGDDFEEIAEILTLADADEARRLIRAAVATIRRQFSESE